MEEEKKGKSEEGKSLQPIIDDLKAIIEKKKAILENIEKVAKSKEEEIKDIYDLFRAVIVDLSPCPFYLEAMIRYELEDQVGKGWAEESQVMKL